MLAVLAFLAWPPPLHAAHGAVAADHAWASEAGVDALKHGGNAVDAACATALMVGLTTPESSGIGGGGFLVLYVAKEHKVVALDFRERAPGRATRDMYVRDGKAVPQLAEVGPLAVGVPGEIAGLAEAVEKYGRLGFRRCVEPAARRAHAGTPVHYHMLNTLAVVAKRPGTSAELAKIFFPGGRPLGEGDLVRRPDFARTLDSLAHDWHGFYRGPIAKEMVRAVQSAGGLLTEKDLAEYRPTWRAPLEGTYRGHRVATMPPPSSGGIALIETLNVLERRDVKAMGLGSSAAFHLLAEALKHAMADRSRFLGDTDFVKVPIKYLTSKDYAGKIDSRIANDRVLKRDDYGTPQSAISMMRDAGTTHLSVVDADGNAAALTTTVNGYFGSRMIAGSTGIILNNEMDDFTTQPGVPNEDGLVTNENNAVAPGKRPLSSMTPTIVFDGERPWIVVGGAGSGRIITGTIQAIVNVVDFGLDAEAAIAAPRIHTQWLPEQLDLETYIPADVAQALARRGHLVHPSSDYCVLQMITTDASGGKDAASDPRKHGAPAGY